MYMVAVGLSFATALSGLATAGTCGSFGHQVTVSRNGGPKMRANSIRRPHHSGNGIPLVSLANGITSNPKTKAIAVVATGTPMLP
jgi:hypothetical protein